MFFKTLPISNTGVSIAYILATVRFLYTKLGSFSDMEYYFYQLAYLDSKVPKRFVGLNQMQCSPSFDWNWGKQNDPTACWHQLHPRFRVLQQGKCLSYPPERVGGVTKTTNCVGGFPFEPPSTGGHPPLQFPPYSLFRPKGSRKTINLFSHFHGLVPDTNYKHLECFVMLGTHSEPHRGQMSHICDISPLRVNKTCVGNLCSYCMMYTFKQNY